MKKCTTCGGAMYDDAVLCPHCHYTIEDAPVFYAENDKVSVGFCILSFFIPLFGLIYWGRNRWQKPTRARACGIVGLISLVINLIVFFYNLANMEIIVTYI